MSSTRLTTHMIMSGILGICAGFSALIIAAIINADWLAMVSLLPLGVGIPNLWLGTKRIVAMIEVK